MSGRMRWVAASAGLALAAALLTACAGDPATVASSVAAPTPEALPAGTLATGTFTDAQGALLGTVTATAADHDQIVFEVSDLTADQGRLGVEAVYAADAATEPCADGPAVAFGDADSSPLVFGLSFGHGDPSFLTQLVLVDQGEGTAPGCVNTIVARAPLQWAFPPLRPYLAALADAGPSAGAEGRATDDGDRPIAYTVVEGDTLGQIADRFGVSAEDVLYLNPARVPSPDDPNVYPGETLNLDLRSR